MARRASASFLLRSMQREDLEAVLALEEEIFPTPWSLNSYTFELERNPASELWVVEAEHSAEIAAYLVSWLLVDEVHIANIAVAPNYRRQGLGRYLLSFALERGIADGARSASLEVRVGNRPARTLYEQFGFKLAGRRKRYYRDNNEDALLMRIEELEPNLIMQDNRNFIVEA